ncbi:MAG TPA: hypothetical protein VKT99_01360 [Xanthobacteraceae bacterium]|nr:hypothetical protein [Xanthobacteraceae bacterium]
MGVRFSFDIGTNSIGSAVWKTGPDPTGSFGADAPRELLWAGVRIFKDGRNPKDGESLAKMRRVPKQARKRRDRFVLRRADLIEALTEAGLTPSDEAARKSQRSWDRGRPARCPPVAPIERSEMRGQPFPDVASLHPGYRLSGWIGARTAGPRSRLTMRGAP